MKNIEYASINGVEVRNLAEQDCEDDILYTGELWMDGEKIGAFEEVFESETKLVIQPEYLVKLEERIQSKGREVGWNLSGSSRKWLNRTGNSQEGYDGNKSASEQSMLWIKSTES